MQELNLPKYQFNIKETEGCKKLIFDELRRKFVKLSPEEWVRQNFIKYLVEEKHYPKGLIAVEMTINISNNKQRCDIICFNKKTDALLIVECKAPKVKITQEVFEQAARYNMNLNTPFLIMTNGINHYCCKIDYKNKSVIYLEDIPDYYSIDY